MILEFTDQALEDYQYWKAHDVRKAARIKNLLRNITETPFTGIGKPEPLLFDLQGYWSRRIDREHRLVYKVADDRITVIACRYHYGKQ